MFAARAAHLANRIRPDTGAGHVGRCATGSRTRRYAYQGAGRGIAEAHIRALESLVHSELKPDLTLLIDVPVAVGLERARARRGGAARDRFEHERSRFFERVREGFLRRARAEPGRIKIIDGNQARRRRGRGDSTARRGDAEL